MNGRNLKVKTMENKTSNVHAKPLVLVQMLINPTVQSLNPTKTLSVAKDFQQWFFDLFFTLSPVAFSLPPDIAAEVLMEPTMRIQSLGYPAENHTVQTSDGYRLNLYRIPSPKKDAIPILLMHGMSSCSDQYIVELHDSLAFQLFRQGFDVWLGNWRGGGYTSHTKLTTKDKEYWNFSFEEMSDKDLPAMIDYILKKTGKKKLAYAGHSMGTIAAFCFFSSHPEYNDKVSSFTALSPIPSLRYTPFLIGPFLRTAEVTLPLLEAVGQYSFSGMNPIMLKALHLRCANPKNYYLCELQQSLLSGWNPYYHNQTRLPVYVTVNQHGFSTKTGKHFSQMSRLNGLYRFDYGAVKNLALYKSNKPPKFDLTKIKIPVYLYFGPNDLPSDMMDVDNAMMQVPNIKMHLINKPMFNHLDIVLATKDSDNFVQLFITNIKKTYF